MGDLKTGVLVSRMMLLLASATPLSALTLPVVERDHLAGTAKLISVPYKLYDSSAGSWVGTRPGADHAQVGGPVAVGFDTAACGGHSANGDVQCRECHPVEGPAEWCRFAYESAS